MSCKTGPEITWSESKPIPNWVSRVPKEPGFLYFVGSASRTESFEEGTRIAQHAALSKIAGYLGTDIKSKFKMTSTDIDQNVGETLKANTEAFVVKAMTVDSYHKKMTRSEGRSILELFDVFVLLKFPEAEAAEEFTRRETKDELTVRAAYSLYQEGDKHEKEGGYKQARRFYHDARKLLAQVRAIIPLGHAHVSDSQKLATLLKSCEENAITQLRRVVVWVVEKNRDKVNGRSIMGSHLAAVLTKHMFTTLEQEPPSDLDIERFHRMAQMENKTVLHFLKTQGAQFLIVAYGNTSYRSKIMNNYFYEAQGTVRVFDTNTGNMILTIPIEHRGYDRNEDNAGMNALREAGTAVGELLVTELLQREND